MRARTVLLLAALLLAGCTGGVSSRTGGPSTGSDYGPQRAPMQAAETMRNVTVASSAFSIDPTQGVSQKVVIPNGTVRVLVTVRFDSGVSDGFEIQVGTCRFVVGGVVAATGQTLSRDCGGIAHGPDDLLVQPATGHLEGSYEVVAQVCGYGAETSGCFVAPSAP